MFTIQELISRKIVPRGYSPKKGLFASNFELRGALTSLEFKNVPLQIQVHYEDASENGLHFLKVKPESELVKRLKNELEVKRLRVSFHKKDGAVRVMDCTRSLSMIPEDRRSEINSYKIIGPKIIGVWDFDNNDFRSFRKDSVIEFTDVMQ